MVTSAFLFGPSLFLLLFCFALFSSRPDDGSSFSVRIMTYRAIDLAAPFDVDQESQLHHSWISRLCASFLPLLFPSLFFHFLPRNGPLFRRLHIRILYSPITSLVQAAERESIYCPFAVCAFQSPPPPPSLFCLRLFSLVSLSAPFTGQEPMLFTPHLCSSRPPLLFCNFFPFPTGSGSAALPALLSPLAIGALLRQGRSFLFP